MILHPRHKIRQLAEKEIFKALIDATKKYGLRFSEILHILNQLMANEIGHLRVEEDKIYKKIDEKENKNENGNNH